MSWVPWTLKLSGLSSLFGNLGAKGLTCAIPHIVWMQFRLEDFLRWEWPWNGFYYQFPFRLYGNLLRKLKKNMNCLRWENPRKDLSSLDGIVPICQTYLVTLSQFSFLYIFWERGEELLSRYRIMITAKISGQYDKKNKNIRNLFKTTHARQSRLTPSQLYHRIIGCDMYFTYTSLACRFGVIIRLT